MSKWSFIDHVTDSLLRPTPGDKKHPTLWPSEATAVVNGKVLGKCRRARFFRYVKESYNFYPKYSFWKPLIDTLERETLPPDKYLLWIWRQGELYEEYLIEQAKTSGVFVAGQVVVYLRDYNVSGKEDIEVINPVTKKFSIIEAKSVYGFGANTVLGTPSQRKNQQLGTPRDSNLMQIGLYDWKTTKNDPAYEHSRLTYGSRDTGRYSEYGIQVRDVDGEPFIFYCGISPVESDWINSNISIQNVLDNFRDTQTAVDTGVVPGRDFKIQYTADEINDLYKAGTLNKTETAQHEKVLERQRENELRIAEGKKPKVELKPVEKGDWQCELCNYRKICYKDDLTPRDI